MRPAVRVLAALTTLIFAIPLSVAAGIGLPDGSFEEDGAVSCDGNFQLACGRDPDGTQQEFCWSCAGDVGVVGGFPAFHLMISQIRVAGGTDDLVEIYNPTDAPVSLAGRSVQFLSASGRFRFRVDLAPVNIPAHGWYLLAADGYAETPARDQSLGTNDMSDRAGHVLLATKTEDVAGCKDAAIEDKVGYGQGAECPEGGASRAAAVPQAVVSISRRPGGTSGNGQDTNLNDTDFLAPAPPVLHNSLSPVATPPVASEPIGVCITPQMPSDGAFAACLSTGDLDGDGTSAVGGVRSDLISPPVSFPFRPGSITVSFEYAYGTSESQRSVPSNDTISATLLTPIGPFPIIVSDSWGTTQTGRGLTREGSPGLVDPNPGCTLVARQSGRIFVTFKKSITLASAPTVEVGPVQVQFSVSHLGDTEGFTFLCIDNVKITAAKLSSQGG